MILVVAMWYYRIGLNFNLVGLKSVKQKTYTNLQVIISTKQDREQFKSLLGNGSRWRILLEYKTQPSPDKLVQALIPAEDFLDGATLFG